MVNHLRIAGTQFGGDHPHVFGKIRFDKDALVVDRARRRQVDVLRHLNDHVGFEVPSLLERHRRESVPGIAFRGAAVGPGGQRLDIGIAQRLVICKMTVGRIGKPGGHLSSHHSSLDRFCPWTRILIGEEGHRRDFAGAMTYLTVLLQNGENAFVECDGR